VQWGDLSNSNRVLSKGSKPAAYFHVGTAADDTVHRSSANGGLGDCGSAISGPAHGTWGPIAHTYSQPGTYSACVIIYDVHYRKPPAGGPVPADSTELVAGSNSAVYKPNDHNADNSAEGNASNSQCLSTTFAVKQPTSLTSTPGGTVAIGSGAKLTDSATLSGGFNPGGTLTFYLFAPGVTPNATNSNNVYTDTVTVSGNGTYTTAMGSNPGGYLPGPAGIYQWIAVYNGDSLNIGSQTAFGDEPETANAATPSLTTTPGDSMVIGSGTPLTDSATLSGGFNPGGTLTFYLFAPGVTPNATNSNNVYTDTVTVFGNGTYTTATGNNPGGYLPLTTTGTYQWIVLYSGDSSNSGATSPFGTEPETVNTATTSLSSTPGDTVVVGSGARLTDSAMLTGGFVPGGAITFYLFAEGVTPNASYSNNVYSDTVTVFGNGTYSTAMGTNPGGYLPTTFGHYQWIAVYSGDSLNNGSQTAFGDEAETATPGTPATPAINTQQHPPSTQVGSSIADSATVTGGFDPSGTVTFNLYNNPNGTGTPLFTDTEPLVGGTATSAGYTATATGTDYWVATYNGDSYNNPVTSGPASEPVTITPATPSINTQQQPPSATVGSSIADRATVAGGFNPTGTVTFLLHNNPNGTGTPLFVDTEPLVGGTATSAGYTATATGTDYWVATYNGDSNNNAVTSGTAHEPVVITPATPAITTAQQPATATVGSSIADHALVSGGFNPTGTVTFNLYNNPNATGTPLFTDTEPLVGGTATSAAYTATAPGTDYWVATYNGDSNNSAVTSGSALEPVTISPGVVSIGDFVWEDLNGNGVQDAGEPGIAGVTVTLTGFSGSNSITAHTTTDATGHYLFTEPAGTYTVTVDGSNFASGALAGYTATPTLQGSPTTDSNPNPSGTTPSSLPGGASDLTVDFGYYRPVTIGDFVWNDLSPDGIQGSGEPGLNGVTLTLTGTTGSGNSVTDHTTTAGNGAYLFTEAPGTYTVTLDASNFASGGALAGFTASPTLQGSDPALDSNPNPSGTTPGMLPSGASDLTIDFGYYAPCSC
jgi:hypothetical protein